MIVPVIMAGGSGTRLWPLSRTAFPKQFLSLGGGSTLLQQSIERLSGLDTEQPLVICNEEHRFLVAEQMRALGMESQVLLEPAGRNTAPAVALAALQVLRSYKVSSGVEPIMLVLAADHLVEDTQAFHKAVINLLPSVQDGQFGTLGILPTEPATGYGYIKSDGDSVEQFVEKPDLDIAKRYVDQGYLWNSGMFLLRADCYLEALKECRPDIYEACERSMESCSEDLDFVRVDKEAFLSCPDESIDYAVMEPLSGSGQVKVEPLNAGWSDVGSWSALWEVADKDDKGNAFLGRNVKDNVVLQDTTDSFIYSDQKLVATIGINNLVVVDMPDALLVADKSKVQDVKKVVAQIKKQNRTEHHQNREVCRPWGKYDSIDVGERYQVKRITVNAGAKLSVQMHHHRAEHWIVVSGTAKVTNGEETYLVTENESTYIPIGQIHALENPGKLPLQMIEVQSGSYLGEDDIVRYQDKYGRCRSE